MLNKNTPTVKIVKLTKVQAKQLREAEAALDRECEKQTTIIYSAGTLALNRHWGWKGKRILALYKMQESIYDECINSGYSMVEMLYNEVGLELRRDDAPDVSFKDCYYLSTEYEDMFLTFPQKLYMKNQQKKWVRTNILACFCISLHRKYGFGFERLVRLLEQIKDIIWDFDGNQEALKAACLKEADFELIDDPFSNCYDRMKENEQTAQEPRT